MSFFERFGFFILFFLVAVFLPWWFFMFFGFVLAFFFKNFLEFPILAFFIDSVAGVPIGEYLNIQYILTALAILSLFLFAYLKKMFWVGNIYNLKR